VAYKISILENLEKWFWTVYIVREVWFKFRDRVCL